ncbi:DUF2934 domain-containing protein [Shinella sp. NM-101]|uniref:DUF2934 domain-containing protein n=1 Tax=Shinella sp. NM-101 TaxID=2744455 RepID=UPI001F1A0099|nr:DUF2934 domain-containing protein [Shinella sp. NM-101]
MADFDERVRIEAYRIWEAEGCPEGQHDRHWQMAMERVRAAPPPARAQAHVVPLPLMRVTLSPRAKTRPQSAGSLRASA